MISGPNFAASRAKRYAPLPRAQAAADADHNERIEGEAVAIVHASDVRFLFLFRQAPPSPVFPPPNQWICPVCAHILVIRRRLAEPVKSTPKQAFPSCTRHGRSAPESCRRR